MCLFQANGTDVAVTETPDVITCDEVKYFWVSWNSGVIQIGSGLTPGRNRFAMPLNDSTKTSVNHAFPLGA